MSELGKEPAFASLGIDKTIKVDEQTTEYYINGHGGMSKRFYAACAAMQGLLANPNRDLRYDNKEDFIKDCYDHADELLRQENDT